VTGILYVSESKKQLETISYFGNFSDMMATGETISTYQVIVSVFTGIDPVPNAMLYGGISVHNGVSIEQRIAHGIVGNIYDILFQVTSNLGKVYEKVTRLAILPDGVPANALHTTAWLTSWNYPYNDGDSIQGNSLVAPNSNLWLQPYFQDSFQESIFIISGNLFSAVISYNILPESIQGDISILSGTLIQVLVTYNMVAESIQGGVAVLSGNLFQGMVFYTIPVESIQGDISIISGVLM
jgi:hypothetical protein